MEREEQLDRRKIKEVLLMRKRKYWLSGMISLRACNTC